MVLFSIQLDFRGRLAQVDRALVSGTKGRAFESHIAHHELPPLAWFSSTRFDEAFLLSCLLVFLGHGCVSLKSAEIVASQASLTPHSLLTGGPYGKRLLDREGRYR